MDIHIVILAGDRRVDDDGNVRWGDNLKHSSALVSCRDEGKPRDEVVYQVVQILKQMGIK